jgi:hypothetical protein
MSTPCGKRFALIHRDVKKRSSPHVEKCGKVAEASDIHGLLWINLNVKH